MERGATLMLQRAPGGSSHCSAQEATAFVSGMSKILQRARSCAIRFGGIPVCSILVSVLDTARRCRVRLETNFTNVILAALVTDGVGKQLDPMMDVLAVVKQARLF